MNEVEQFVAENKQWRSDHSRWLTDVEQWQHHTQRLVAILFKLERCLPEQSAKLKQHTSLIDKYETEIRRYECGLDTQCLTDCESFKALPEQRQFHRRLSQLHQKMQHEHVQFSQQYAEKMQRFRTLAKKLITELDS